MIIRMARCFCFVGLVVTMVFCNILLAARGIESATILGPNVSSCLPPIFVPVQELQSGLHCCPPQASYPPRLFTPPPPANSSHQLRMRKRAHAADPAYARRLARAYTLMRALPANDPRSFLQQANIHCAYCNSIYTQLNYASQRFQVHGCWLFYPFHRWYLYFHERILAKLLLEDDSEVEDQLPPFALPFWNYDHPNGSTMPWLFAEVPELQDPRRNPFHAPPAVLSLDTNPSSDDVSPEIQLRENANVMYRTFIRDGGTQEKFFGKSYRPGDSPMPGSASAEDEPHGTVHEWTGNYTQVGWKDMGALYASGRDPIFYSHHAELDRLWEVWLSFEGNRNLRDEGFLSSEFVFYNENAELVRVRAGDAINTKALGYVYEEVEVPWKDAIPIRQSRGVMKLTPNDTVCKLGSPLEKPCSVMLEREPSVDSGGTEYLVINGTTWPLGFQSFFTIYLNLPSADNGTTTGCPEYVGCFRAVDQARLYNFPANSRPSASFDITERISDLRLGQQKSVVVTLVPKFGSTNGPSAAPTISGSIAIQYR